MVMRSAQLGINMTTPVANEADWPELKCVRRATVVIDMVESVRMVQADPLAVIERWRRLVHQVRTHVLPGLSGRMVKHLGDGMLLDFERIPVAVAAARKIQRIALDGEAGFPEPEQIRLRAGVHCGDVMMDDLDVFGPSVNLAARLAGLARPGEIVISSEVRDGLVDGLDAEIEDMGWCWLKHVDEPIRAARIDCNASPGQATRLHSRSRGGSEAIGIAVLPFRTRSSEADVLSYGDILADDVIAQLSRMPQLRVISRLSTSAFRNRPADLSQAAEWLEVPYLVHGDHVEHAGEVRVNVQMVESDSQTVVMAGTYAASADEVRAGEGDLTDRIVAELCAALVGREVRRACTQPLPTLVSYTILLGAIALLHSLSLRDFNRSREMLTYLIERHPALPTPRAWLGLWHVMRVGQGWSADPAADAGIARSFIAAALDLDPTHALSLAVDGLVCAYVHKDLSTAGDRYAAALHSNPNEGLAWLFRSAWHAYQEEGEQAVSSALHAQRLSPLDPMKYYYDNFTSTAMLANGDLAGAIEYGQRSLRANRLHGPTLRILAIAHSLAGRAEPAAEMIRRMLELEPAFSVSAFMRRYPGRRQTQVDRYVQALREAGLPE
jgi:adenylate cyclase